MKSVCPAGTGSFLEQRANRLGISINELGQRATRSKSLVRIADRCTGFAESDMTHKQQMGHPVDDIIYSLCQVLVRNYLNNLALGKTLLLPVVFQGGEATNAGVVRAFEEALETNVTVLPQYDVMGVMGAALLTREQMNGQPSNFKGFDAVMVNYKTTSFECQVCPNLCGIAQIKADGRLIARWGGAAIAGEFSDSHNLTTAQKTHSKVNLGLSLYPYNDVNIWYLLSSIK